MSLYEVFVRPLLFHLEPEKAHEIATSVLAAAGKTPGAKRALASAFRFENPALETRVAGLRFPNPVGLAAGFDKDCRLAGILPAFGFGFLELGTVTPRPQPGNPSPRVFRIPEALAIINRLGFNSRGSAYAAKRLSELKDRPVPLGINIGMNADTPPEKAAHDYVEVFTALREYGDYFVVNVSSPNTQGLRELQERLKLERILTAIKSANKARKPIFVKLSPDLGLQQLAGLIPLILQEANGLVATNTTVSREGVPERWAEARGGLSGVPLQGASTRLIAEIYKLSDGKLPIIGSGGVFSIQDAYQKIRAGASLIQVYTGWIYRGPGFIREINRDLVEILEGHGLKSIQDAVGRSSALSSEIQSAPVPIAHD